ncbi:MAG: hypothetical protein DSZ28_04535 [Thiothrix sp.]|nr:MAG: hypothetical protein DSZ28_04535 [Thiothrix sp.]
MAGAGYRMKAYSKPQASSAPGATNGYYSPASEASYEQKRGKGLKICPYMPWSLTIDHPNQVWATDITQLSTRNRTNYFKHLEACG